MLLSSQYSFPICLHSLRQTYPGGPGNVAARQFNPGYIDNTNPAPNNVVRVEFYAYLIGSIIRAETVV